MHLLYLDDSGSPANASESYFVLGGISIYEAQADFLTRELDQLAASIDARNPTGVEFHASEIFSRRKQPWRSMSIDDARSVVKAVLRIIAASYDTTKLFACAVEKASAGGVDSVEAAFEDLCSRFDLYLTRLKNQGDRQRGLLILDKSTSETTLQRLTREFRLNGTRWGGIRNLADIPFFVDSAASRLVQLADHVAYAVFRRYNAGDAQYFDIIASRFDSADGVVHGLSHKCKTPDQCMCPACLSRRLTRRVESRSILPGME